MKMHNLLWTKDEQSFPQILGGGDATDWWVCYADVSLTIDKDIFQRYFHRMFLWFAQFHREIKLQAGDTFAPFESRTRDGDYIPWGDNDFGPDGQMTMLEEYFYENND